EVESERMVKETLSDDKQENMTPEQKSNNKNYILNNLDKYVIDSRQYFYGEDAESKYTYIAKDALPDGAFEEIRDQIYQKIIQNKND
ncbi:1645_t:CDS:2, partial [Ambispora leptoticha]